MENVRGYYADNTYSTRIGDNKGFVLPGSRAGDRPTFISAKVGKTTVSRMFNSLWVEVPLTT